MDEVAPNKKAQYARGRRRDARGRFLPVADSRRARIRASLAGSLGGLVGEADDVLGALARRFGRGAIRPPVVDTPGEAAPGRGPGVR